MTQPCGRLVTHPNCQRSDKRDEERSRLEITEATLRKLKEIWDTAKDGEPVRLLHGGKQTFRNIGVGQSVPNTQGNVYELGKFVPLGESPSERIKNTEELIEAPDQPHLLPDSRNRDVILSTSGPVEALVVNHELRLKEMEQKLDLILNELKDLKGR